MRDGTGDDEDGCSHLNTEGLRIIAKSIAQNSILQSFEIHMGATSITDQTGLEIAKSIAQNSTLQDFKINMEDTNISDQTGVEIAKSIAQNSTLQSFEINMEDTNISDQRSTWRTPTSATRLGWRLSTQSQKTATFLSAS